MDYDVKITGGTIIDGSGKPGVQGDVGIKSGRIAAIGKVHGGAARTIDAGGLVVAPGFVDIHTHYDAQTRPEHRGLIMRTLEKVEGMSFDALEGGLGYEWPFQSFPEYLNAIERR